MDDLQWFEVVGLAAVGLGYLCLISSPIAHLVIAALSYACVPLVFVWAAGVYVAIAAAALAIVALPFLYVWLLVTKLRAR